MLDSSPGGLAGAGRIRLTRAQKYKKIMKTQIKSNIFLRATAALLLVGAVSGVWMYNQFYGNAVMHSTDIYIDSRDVDSYESLLETKIFPNIKHHWAFKIYAKRLNLSTSIKGGRYVLNPNTSVVRLVRLMKLGEQSAVNVTFNNTRTCFDLAGRLAAQLEADSLQFLDALTSRDIAKSYSFSTKENIITLFIPNTYSVNWNITPEKFVARMKGESDKFWDNSSRDAKRKVLDMSREDIITLASIVYEETKVVGEMPRVAGVYINRLRVGMLLQADPTVKYAMGDFSIKRVLHKHLEVDSPYNTYKYAGLPPSPISMPSIDAIDAVLNYEKHSYLYLCANPSLDGRHSFAKNYSEHLRNARLYSEVLNRLNIK